MVAFRLADIDVTPEQRDRIVAIPKGVANDLESSREQHMRLDASRCSCSPRRPSRLQLEKLRAEQMQLGEALRVACWRP